MNLSCLRAAALLAAFCFGAPALAQPAPDAPPSQTQSAPAAFDLDQLPVDIRAAVEDARDAQTRAERYAARAQSAARRASRSRNRDSNTVNGFGRLEMNGGSVYTGALSEGVVEGIGLYEFADGPVETYAGEFAEGQIHGLGVYTWRSGGEYAGARELGARQGPGIYTFADGRRYEGAWAEDQRNGLGVEWSAEGAVLGAGTWRNDALIAPIQR